MTRAHTVVDLHCAILRFDLWCWIAEFLDWLDTQLPDPNAPNWRY